MKLHQFGHLKRKKVIQMFVRPGVIKNVNTYAQEQELSKITPRVIMEAKRHFGEKESLFFAEKS